MTITTSGANRTATIAGTTSPPSTGVITDPAVSALSSQVVQLTAMVNEMQSRWVASDSRATDVTFGGGTAVFTGVLPTEDGLHAHVHVYSNADRGYPHPGPVLAAVLVGAFPNPRPTNDDTHAAHGIPRYRGLNTDIDQILPADSSVMAVLPTGTTIDGSPSDFSPSDGECIVLLGPAGANTYVRILSARSATSQNQDGPPILQKMSHFFFWKKSPLILI